MRPKSRFSIFYFSLVCLLGLFVHACKKDKSEPSPPIVTTRGVTEITPHSAKFGGNIDSDGKETVTASGFCFSKENPTPTIADDTTLTPAATTGGFVSEIKNLEPSTTYYFRAYAINSLGTGYGEVLSFSTSNAPPVVSDVMISGSAVVDSILSSMYTYSDIENDQDSGTSFQWYGTLDTLGTEETPIPGAIYSTYTIVIDDTNRFIRVGVTPASLTGTTPGTQVKSNWIGHVISLSPTNAAPVASDVTINGSPAVDSIITTTYTYSDIENDPESGTAFQWYSAVDTIVEETLIPDAINSSYTIVSGDSGKFLRVGVTPASSTGTSPGAPVKSYWVGPVP